MNLEHDWYRSFQRFFAGPVIGTLAVATLVGASLYAIADAEPAYRPHHVMAVFGPR